MHTKKIESQLTNFMVYDLETHNADRARPYLPCFNRICKLAGENNKEKIIPHELDKSKKDTIAFDCDDCVTNVLDFCLKVKGNERKVKNKIVENNFQIHAHDGSGFDTWVILNNLSCDKHIVNIIKNGKSIQEFKVFNGHIEKIKKQIPQYLHFRCGMTL